MENDDEYACPEAPVGDDALAPGASDAPISRSLLVFSNPDKQGDRPSGPEEWCPRWPYRCCLSGPPNSGKRNHILNLVFKMHPPPSCVLLVHVDPETREYDILEELGVPLMVFSYDDFPTDENIKNPDPPPFGDTADGISSSSDSDSVDEPRSGADLGSSPLVIVDEITSDLLSKEMKVRFERLVNFTSSHRNCTVLCSIQDMMSLQPKVRRAFNHFDLWASPDANQAALVAKRAGIPKEMVQDLLKLCVERRDSIWIDCTRPSGDPYQFRLNIMTPIRVAETVRTDVDYP